MNAKVMRRIYKAIIELLETSGGNPDHAFMAAGCLIGKTPPGTCLQPDVCVQHPDQPEDEYFESAPLLAVEVVSESCTAEQLDGKIRAYLDSGSCEVWIVYRHNRSLWRYFPGGTACRHTSRFSTGIFPGRQFPLDTIWADGSHQQCPSG